MTNTTAPLDAAPRGDPKGRPSSDAHLSTGAAALGVELPKCAPRGQVPVTDDMVLAAARVMSPYLFAHGLDGLPTDGPRTKERMRKETDLVRRMLEAAAAKKD